MFPLLVYILWPNVHCCGYACMDDEQALKPTVLIGTSGRGGTFTKEALEEIASYQDVCLHHQFLSYFCKSFCQGLQKG